MEKLPDSVLVKRFKKVELMEKRPLLHRSTANWILYDPYSNRLFTGDVDNNIIVSDYDTNKLIKVLEGYNLWVQVITFMSKPGQPPKWIASSDSSGLIIIWNAENYQFELIIKTDQDQILGLTALSENTLLSGSFGFESTLKYWDITRKINLVRTIKLYGDCNAILEIDKAIIACGNGNRISLFLMNLDFKLFKTLSGHKVNISRLIKLPNKKDLLISSSRDLFIRIWKWRKGECIRIMYHPGDIWGLLPISENIFASTANDNPYVYIWNIDEIEPINMIKSMYYSIWSIGKGKGDTIIVNGGGMNDSLSEYLELINY